LFKDFPTLTSNDDDIQRGVVELKATRWECEFKAYYVAQSMWEMQSTNTLWCDIVRYSTGRWKRDPVTNRYKLTSQKCLCYRLYRRKKYDLLLQQCVVEAVECRSKNDKMAYLRLMESPPFVKMRKYCERVTKKCNTQAKEIPIAVSTLMAYKDFREKAYVCAIPELGDPVLSRINKRHKKIVHLYESRDETFTEMANDQIADYSVLIESFFSDSTKHK
jgi:hypothetical protein